MKRSVCLSTAILLFTLANQIFAQDFIPAYDRFSGKEISYIMLEDGSKVEGTLEDLDRKKGLIQEVVIKDASGKKQRSSLNKSKPCT